MTGYPRRTPVENCGHAPEAHVVYETAGYRAQLRCGCGRVRVDGRRLREHHARAAADARTMLELAEAHITTKRKEP